MGTTPISGLKDQGFWVRSGDINPENLSREDGLKITYKWLEDELRGGLLAAGEV